jgi:hypothetical protein
MKARKPRVEIFLGPLAATFVGGLPPARQESISRAYALRRELENVYEESIDVRTWDLGTDADYTEGLRRLALYLGDAGDDRFSSHAAFSINYITPAVAVNCKLVSIGDCPEADLLVKSLHLELLDGLGIIEALIQAAQAFDN